ncbi:response regulator transcription factor [Paenibacillus tyrfis]|uniref:response regulator transcription factor n=1 Tax=Paenibacillus tyrfis TaxID=1501230 RepID=UPI00209DCE69|nr:response regulator transcription factor [Paenibacillus tyrfis]MCP1308122.1 response regulator transcription factor [Paenibacillus tyrfis]
MKNVTVLIVGFREIVLLGLTTYLNNQRDLCIFSEKYESENKTFELIQSLRPDVLIFELNLEQEKVLSVIERMCKAFVNLKIMIYSAYESFFLEDKILLAGADAFLTRDTTMHEIYESILMVSRKFKISNCKKVENNCLSPQEEKVLEFIALGLTNKEISNQLQISERTVSYYVSNILIKLDAQSRVGAALKGVLKGYVKNEIVELILK